MKQTIQHGIRHIALSGIVVILAALTACSEKENNFSFRTPSEALSACHQELSKVRPLKDADIDRLIAVTSTWLELHDSTLNCIMRDSTAKNSAEIATDYFAVTDSFRTEIMRLALSAKRTLPDIVKLKVGTAIDRKRIQQSDDYHRACEFYSGTEESPLYADPVTTLSEYEKLLTSSAGDFKKEKELYDFLRKEDRCFRSLLVFLKDIPQSKLQTITDRTSEIFDRLYHNAAADLDNKVNERVMLFLTMRFNRRILQNAEVCRQDILKNVELNDIQATNYRWMIIQPFMTIDSEAMAVLTEEQVSMLTTMSSELPRLLAYVDGKDFDKSPKEDTAKLEGVLTDYFLRSYLKSIL